MSNTIRKNKITLNDYNYRQDIENRLFMADLSILEVDVLSEIINGSLKTYLSSLADNLNVNPKTLKTVLEKLAKTRLFKIQGEEIIVDKEMRKYYETQISKFDDHFQPDLEYLQSLLSKVPLHSLLVWYAIPRNSDHIFQSIIEKIFSTPKIYERYLQELSFEEPIFFEIMKAVFSAPDYLVRSDVLIDKFKLSKQQFEEYMLYLEFSFVCCISYIKTESMWEEVVTPFHEWREYLLFLQNTSPMPIKDVQKIKCKYPHEFGFLKELNDLVHSILEKEVLIKNIDPELIEAAQLLKIAKKEELKLSSTSQSKEWLDKSLIDQAIVLYRETLKRMLDLESTSFSEKDFREVERSLRRIGHGKWVYFEDFMKGCLAQVGSVSPIHLHNKGKRWRYLLPKYHENEVQFIQQICCQYLLQAGMVNVGTHEDKLCLCLTKFGRQSLV